ncbi:hypothetical protein [Burkholderia cepacia]|uniref:hypothetical protein n=1 Tax=Burkholderia cepacia TaxID=292 RepID=UPI002ABD31E3|nr:hypothetical protein [Burkholderia cepacia]
MSQAFLSGTHDGRRTQLMAGWDGIEGDVYAKVAYLDERGDWIEEPGLLLDTVIRLDARPDLGDAWMYVDELVNRIAVRVGIAVPDAMRTEICRAMLENDNRSRVWFNADGTLGEAHEA